MTPTRKLRIAAVVAAVFGLATVISGGRALFGDAAAQAAVGQAVGFVLWFNFLAGFAYVAVAVGLLSAAALGRLGRRGHRRRDGAGRAGLRRPRGQPAAPTRCAPWAPWPCAVAFWTALAWMARRALHLTIRSTVDPSRRPAP
jgi:hypothetical protein